MCSLITSLVTLIILVASYISGQTINTCRTPNSATGQCIPIRSCASLWKLVTETQRPYPTRIVQFLQQSVCGNPSEQTICCPLQGVQETSNNNNNQLVTNNNGQIPVAVGTGIINAQQHRNIRLLPLSDCGPVSSDRIANGNQTVLYEFPWMARLGYQDFETSSPDWRCGGSVVSRR